MSAPSTTHDPPAAGTEVLQAERDLLRRRLAEVEASFLHTIEESQREVLRMNEALAAANARLAELDRMKDAFLSMVTHELRTPLTVIAGISEMLEAGIYGALTGQQAEHINQISAQAARLRELVNDLLDLSKLEAGMMKLRRARLDSHLVAQGAMQQLVTLADSRQIELFNRVAPGLPAVDGDGQRIEQVLINLLSNAIKFTPARGTVTLTADALPDAVRLHVTDTGRGIAPDALPHIFDKFFQVQSNTETGARGTGLGLAIVKQIVELHGGEVGVESVLGRGSRFWFTLPRAAVKSAV